MQIEMITCFMYLFQWGLHGLRSVSRFFLMSLLAGSIAFGLFPGSSQALERPALEEIAE